MEDTQIASANRIKDAIGEAAEKSRSARRIVCVISQCSFGAWRAFAIHSCRNPWMHTVPETYTKTGLCVVSSWGPLNVPNVHEQLALLQCKKCCSWIWTSGSSTGSSSSPSSPSTSTSTCCWKRQRVNGRHLGNSDLNQLFSHARPAPIDLSILFVV